MNHDFDAIIIGSGIGGSAVGALLAHAGWKILIIEKNKIVGGRCTSYAKDGFTVDLGIHLFGVGNRGALGDICRRIGRPDAIQWVTINSAILRLKDRVMKYSRKNLTAELPDKEKQNMERFFKAVVTMPQEEISTLWYIPLHAWLSQFTDHPLVHAFIERISSQYFCVRDNASSTAEFVKCFREVLQARSSAYPVGGCISIPRAYLTAVKKLGGEVKLRTRVEKIIVENHKAVGVKLKDGSKVKAPVIISNADIKASVLDLVGEEHFSSDYLEAIRNLSYAYHVIGLKVALQEKITDDQLMMYMPYDFEKSRQIESDKMDGKIPELMRGMITSPTNYDTSLAPEGRQLIFFGTGCPRKADWKKWEEALLRSFYTVYPQARGKVLWHKVDTPDLVNTYAGEDGNVIGVAQSVNQIHERRPSVTSPLEGLFFASAEAGGHGIGAELAADSARELFQTLTLH
ncbi:MAG: FAD-dependent oxidoreductase [Thermodesulfobacteriota bacterium]